MSAVLDDHLLRDLLAGEVRAELDRVAQGSYATTNLFYSRLCRSAVAAEPRVGKLLGSWPPERRRALIARLVELPPEVTVVPMGVLAWRMATIAADHPGLSTLGAEAVAAAEHLGAGLCVSADHEGPRIRRAAQALGLGHHAIGRA